MGRNKRIDSFLPPIDRYSNPEKIVEAILSKIKLISGTKLGGKW